MKRDMDLIRKILLAIEAEEGGYASYPLEIEGYSDTQVGYHAYLMIDAGLVDGTIRDFCEDDEDEGEEGGPSAPWGRISHLTFAGHDFLDAARDETRWRKARVVAGEVTLGVLKELLVSYARDQLGLR